MIGQGLRYLAVGVANTGLGLAVILALDIGLGLNSFAANALGYLVGAGCSYALNRGYTFRSRRSHRRALPAFVLLMLACWAANALILLLTHGLLNWPSLPAQVLAVSIYAVLFFVGSRSLVFRDHR